MIDFDERAIILGAQVTGKNDAIQRVAQTLAELGHIDPAYVDSMLARETVANTYLGNGIAIPHGLPEGRHLIKKTGIVVLQVPDGLTWNPGEIVYLVVGIAAKSDEHIPILTRLTHVLDDPETTERLALTKDRNDIVSALRDAPTITSKPAPVMDLTGFNHSVDVVITGAHGLHARPATFFVDVTKNFDAEIFVEYDGRTANGSSLASLLKLGVTTGKTIRIHAKGNDARAALMELKIAVDSGLGDKNEDQSATLTKQAHCWEPQQVKQTIPGISASPGLGIGPIKQYTHSRIVVETNAKDPVHEKTALHEAIAAAKMNLRNLYEEVRARAGVQRAAIFRAHEAFLEDPELIAEAEASIERGKSAGYAWRQAIDPRVYTLEQHDDQVLAGRAMDLQDVGRRVLRHLAGVVQDEFVAPDSPVILVAEDLTPSDTATLDPARILGFCTASGGPTSHSAIIARSLGIPAIVGAGPAVLNIKDGLSSILDGDAGMLYLEPSQDDLDTAAKAQKQILDVRDQEHATRFQPALTRDGKRVEVVANIGKVNEAEQAVNAGAEGVGLMRTEFLFLGRETPPDEDEQFQSYKAMVETLNGLPIIIRTLDIGGDKAVPYLDLPHEENPFLGERGIRLCLNRPELFSAQLRAIYRASKHGPIKIMFPMITTLEDLTAAKRLAEKARIETDAEPIDIGIMVEVPSVAIMAAEFAHEVDFFSVGTNDLTQYVMAIDRLHPTLAAQADSLHPAILRLIKQVVDAADQAGIWVGVCGGLAGEPLGALILAGLGVHELSMVVPSVAAVKAKLRTINMSDAAILANKALACKNVKQVRALTMP